LPGNLANLIEAAAKARFTAKMKGELKAMLASGKARTVKLGNGVELKAVGFKGPNQFGKHADVLIRIRQMNAKQITLIGKNQFSKISKNLSAKSLGRDAFKYDKVLSISRQASDELWELRRLTGSPWLSTIKVNAALTVLPTLVNDVTNNFNHHAKLDQKFNFKQFGMDSLVNQSSNLVAAAGGVATAKIAAIFLPAALVAGAPLIVIGAIGTVVIGTAFTFYGGDKAISNKMKTLFGEDS